MGVYSDCLTMMSKIGIENSEGELHMLIAELTGVNYCELLKFKALSKLTGTDVFDRLIGENSAALIGLVQRRINGEPVQYILGYAEFFGRRFIVNENVLIPRFDTEFVVECACSIIKDDDKVLDLCCGSGCIGITIALEKQCEVTLADNSEKAIEICRKNADLLNADNTKIIIHDVCTDILEDTYDVIVSNPPYIETSELPKLMPEVRREPKSALDGGEDGLDFYRIISKNYINSLNENGRLVFEIGAGQEQAIADILKFNGYSDIALEKDYCGKERTVICYK